MKKTDDKTEKHIPRTRTEGLLPLVHEIICRLIITYLSAYFTPLFAAAQDEPPYDEISVYVKIPYIGVGEIDAVIRDDEIYLPVTDLFDFLKIRNVPSEDLDLITGFFIHPEAEYQLTEPKT